MMAAGMPAADTVLALDDLAVRFDTPDGPVAAVRGISLAVRRGETVAIVGESGSGKTQAMMAVMGLLPDNGHASGSARYRGTELLGLPPRALNRIRGARMAMIFQEPMTSLDPLYSVGWQIAETLRRHSRLGRAAARERALALLRRVGIPQPERRIRAYPHELSGGQRQRVMIAMALANRPEVLIADEPTTALDVTVQAQILDLLAELRAELGMAIVFITHDLGLVRRFADTVHVMRDGAVVESGPAAGLFAAPRHAYTQALVAATPSGGKAPVAPDAPLVLAARRVTVEFVLRRVRGGGRLAIRACDNVDLDLRQGQTIGIVGESGSGKSTLGRALLRLLPSSGAIRFLGRPLPDEREALRPLRRQMQLVFQDPYGSLSPRLTVGEIVGEGLRVHEPDLSAAERDRRVGSALEDVQIDPAWRRRYPHEFSGGQRQRIAIARAVVLRPRLLVLDEPTSALDRTVQKQIIELLRRLQGEHDLSYIFISHDLAVVRALADTILVMKDGRVVERGLTEAVFADPQDAYTRALMAAAFAATPFGAAVPAAVAG